MNNTRPHSYFFKKSGFTLVELMITIAISAILMGIAVPSFSSLFQSTKIQAAAQQMVVELNAARALAMTSQKKVVMCRSTDNETCLPNDTATNNNWSSGWITFIDSESTSPIARSTAETLYRIVDGEQFSNLSIKHSTRLRTFSNIGTTVAGHYQFCDDSGGDIEAVKVIIIGTGRPRIEKVVGLNVCPS
jgi:type IV fimbrial biogenesis protein FimT